MTELLEFHEHLIQDHHPPSSIKNILIVKYNVL